MNQEANKWYWDQFWSERKLPGSQYDLIFQDLSHRVIADIITENSDVLIAGCGDGHGIDMYKKSGCSLVGMDYSQSAIEIAIKSYPDIEFLIWDMRDMIYAWDSKFDYVITERSLTNIIDVQEQKKALRILSNYLKDNGRLIICEPYQEGYNKIDEIRVSLGLDKLMPHHNAKYFDERIFDDVGLEVEQSYTFGVYTMISRILYPLMIYPEEPQYNAFINEFASRMCYKLMRDNKYKDLPSQHKLWILSPCGFKYIHPWLKENELASKSWYNWLIS